MPGGEYAPTQSAQQMNIYTGHHGSRMDTNANTPGEDIKETWPARQDLHPEKKTREEKLPRQQNERIIAESN